MPNEFLASRGQWVARSSVATQYLKIDPPRVLWRHSKESPDCGMRILPRSPECSHRNNLRIGQVCVAMKFAAWSPLWAGMGSVCRSARHSLRVDSRPMLFAALEAFGVHSGPVPVARDASPCGLSVDRVVSVSTWSQVCRVAARWVVARMQNIGSVGRNTAAVGQNPCNAVGHELAPARPHSSVASLEAAPGPLPTFAFGPLARRLIDPRPESCPIFWGDIIRGKHRNLHSGGPLGVTSTARGSFVALNYSTDVRRGLQVQALEASRG